MKNTAVILDIGAHNGQSIEKLYKQYSHYTEIEIHSFEPIPENFYILCETARNLMEKYPRLTCFTYNFALDKTSRLSPFYCYGMHTLETNQYSSLLSLNAKEEWLTRVPNQPRENLTLSKTILVSCHTVDEFINILNIKKVAYLKIDTQGNDFNVLLGAMNSLKTKVFDKIEIECQNIELYKDSNSFKEIDDLLLGLDYKLFEKKHQAAGFEYVLEYVLSGSIDSFNIIDNMSFLSTPKIDLLLPEGYHSWNVSDGWINTIQHNAKLGNIIRPSESNKEEIFKYISNPEADMIFLLGFDHHMPFLHNSEKLRDLWKNSSLIKVLLAQETVIQDCYPENIHKSNSALQCSDIVFFNSYSDKNFYAGYELPSFWQPFGVDQTVFLNYSPYDKRILKPYFRGKTKPIGLPHTYARRRELLQLLLDNEIVDYQEFEFNNTVNDLVHEFNQYKISINLPAVFKGFTTRVFESLATGCSLLTPKPNSIEEYSIFNHLEHVLYYNEDDTQDFLKNILFLLNNPEEAKCIAERGYNEVISKHTLTHRLNEILEKINCLESKL